ncbi:hypothetical protein [Chitinophaga barathri]|uniref:Uncharacterized protein n=1 Tax=Chitinophaga barathri TaxID=1647451 RepID=A0A3N4N375_9BACT|nr:hypothetical protein [Chitinophaga barathri]RPD42063.1 hypothetical protein EG028_07890 [Chitinophaga barathri]
MIKSTRLYHTRFIGAIVILAGMMMAGCKKADQQYDTLHKQPEILAYNDAYMVGDTLVMQGRLNPEYGLRIRIGDVDSVSILAKEKIVYSTNIPVYDTVWMDRIKIVITQQMGIGPNRTVAVTSAGNTIPAQPIEILENETAGLVQPMKITRMYTLTGGSKILYCRSGNGNIYLWTQLSPARSISRLSPDGTLVAILSAANYVDGHGAFTITAFNGGGVDPQERYLYFSAVTTDNSADNAANEIYRFCKVDLTTLQLTTLNRTLYPKTASQRTLSALTPFEGNINNVKIFNATGVYPDSSGNVYINKSNFLLARLDAAGNYSYLFRFRNYPSWETPAAFVPQIWDTSANRYYTADDVQFKFKNNSVAGYLRAVAPDDGLLYCIVYPSVHDLAQYDLANQVRLFTFEPKLVTGTPYISGSFSLLTGYPQNVNGPAAPLFGYMAMPGQKLLLFYQVTSAGNFPAFGVLNFAQHRGERYAPGKVERDITTTTVTLTAGDEILNYDANGMLYMTGNSRQYILKTISQ